MLFFLCGALQLTKELSRSVDLNQGWFCPPGDIWQCLETFLIVTVGEEKERAAGIQQVAVREAADHPTVLRTAFPQQRMTQSKMYWDQKILI